ncbi:VOC family protein [Martelella endophytica]|uniref:VOC domain-containing protein n=1 Tax=Martelella endophytica TaxID=1486262 RepID=A0A0D5LJS0_MAREN|nr:VOC family protein [Martelella endophytica]AJY44434.1 hypothetical protein TM49_00075 [Martelella endophytica]
MSALPLNLVVLYVEDPKASAAFYAEVLGLEPRALSDGFSSLATAAGLTLGLWRKATAHPPAEGGPGSAEIGIMTPEKGGVEALYARFRKEGRSFAQPLVQSPFGPTFVITDPDGHRIRVCQPD